MLFAGSGVDLSAVASAKAERTPQDLAAKLSGTWVFNRELSYRVCRARPGPWTRRATAPSAARRLRRRPRPWPHREAAAAAATPSDLTPEQRAEQAAMRELQQIDSRITIKASATEVTFIDSLGEQTFAINDKTATIFIASSPVKVKLKWDKQALKQEFSNTQAKLVQTWSVDGADRLVMTAKVESLTLVTPERKAVFDRQ